eukprot:364971-Chlamydomonas_euryale.AAC.13
MQPQCRTMCFSQRSARCPADGWLVGSSADWSPAPAGVAPVACGPLETSPATSCCAARDAGTGSSVPCSGSADPATAVPDPLPGCPGSIPAPATASRSVPTAGVPLPHQACELPPDELQQKRQLHPPHRQPMAGPPIQHRHAVRRKASPPLPTLRCVAKSARAAAAAPAPGRPR